MSILLSCLLTLAVVKAAPVTDSMQLEDQAMWGRRSRQQPQPLGSGPVDVAGDLQPGNAAGKHAFSQTGSKFWKFDPQLKPPVKSTYPKPISNWEGIPDNLDAALQYTNGYTYFFKGGNYYRFNDGAFMVATVDPPFPRPTGEWWFGCKPNRLRQITPAVMPSPQYY